MNDVTTPGPATTAVPDQRPYEPAERLPQPPDTHTSPCPAPQATGNRALRIKTTTGTLADAIAYARTTLDNPTATADQYIYAGLRLYHAATEILAASQDH
ncbi:hypothetical protein [Actinomadura rubrisoli]|uniref:Uncharacterized protein n=1 Tax=Actinomadura rubrisoli TaxID=2530368 RepID=A0A4V2YVG2_9ACTN|nr:hypothetical protein [Actinomadura rubrisoli]TDD81447.1 hypothetical protein E1298_24075 [Actinomadura rubrisoli]